jgi:hypothetical protein
MGIMWLLLDGQLEGNENKGIGVMIGWLLIPISSLSATMNISGL